MNTISCDICMDLIPLVRDGVASEDSVAAVEEHLKTCPACRKAFGEGIPAPAKEKENLIKIGNRIRVFTGMLLMFGMVFGVSLTADMNMFRNSLIMPALGCLGYFLFRWRALYLMPVLLYATSAASFLLGLMKGLEPADSASMLIWAGLYAVFAVAGVLIAGLLHFALRKEENDEKESA